MSDLISRSALRQEILDKFPQGGARGVFLAFVDDAPTAYDVDKVVQQLEEELSFADKEKERCLRENPLFFDRALGYSHGISVALDIVRAGGKE